MATRERVAARLKALLTASCWVLGGVACDSDAEAVAYRAVCAFAQKLMLAQPTRAYGQYVHAEWAGKAAAFRGGAGLTSNKMLGSWHSQLKGAFLHRTNRSNGLV